MNELHIMETERNNFRLIMVQTYGCHIGLTGTPVACSVNICCNFPINFAN